MPATLPGSELPTSRRERSIAAEMVTAQSSLRFRLTKAATAQSLPQLVEQLQFSLNAQGSLRIDGQVSNYYLKQMAQELAQRDRAVLRVENRITVSKTTCSNALGLFE